MVRLQKVLAEAGVASRRKSEELILAGRVKVNGIVVKQLGVKVNAKKDEILVDNEPIIKESKVYYLLNKPAGTVTTVKDEKNRPTVLDLLAEEDKDNRIYPVGRLDYETQGLIILTNDGELTYKLTHPKHGIEKEYLARINGIMLKNQLRNLRLGIKLADGHVAIPKYASIEELDKVNKTTLVKIVLTEGKNREVRNIFKAMDFEVLKLTRTRYAFLTTEGVGRGYYRPLKVHEIKKLMNL